ncbi:MAG: diacylglycerol kinase [Treponema sp.]|nr:diacylglycerol kinase [Treponema sp.]
MEVFASLVEEICAHTRAAPGRIIKWTIIANPVAGGFTIRSRWKRHHETLAAAAKKAAVNPLRKGSGPSRTALESGDVLGTRGLVRTGGPGHAGKIAGELVAEALAESAPAEKKRGRSSAPSPESFYLVITAGGDGTSLEVLSALYHAGAAFRSRFAVLRLPMGTGNDGADGVEDGRPADIGRALDLLILPVKTELSRALRLVTAQSGPAKDKGPFLAFNILSVGLDAFVTHMTNRMKGGLPGDSYKLWVDIAALLYDRLYKIDFLEVRALDERGRELTSFREKLLLLAVGVSGRRTYGSHKKILPDDRNVCAVKQMPLLRKIALKGLFTTGAHIRKPESILFSARRVEFSGLHPILAQMDGETVLLQKEDFPAAIELTDPVIPVLRPV